MLIFEIVVEIAAYVGNSIYRLFSQLKLP